jgi:regulator of RNase E activity RraA
VVVIPAGVAEEVIAKAEDVVQTENLVRNEILDGVHPLDAYKRHGRF